MRFIISEQDRDEILNKYQGNTDDKIMVYLRRHYTIVPPVEIGLRTTSNRVLVDDKVYEIDSHKKYLVNKIFYEIEDEFVGYDKGLIRRTIKKFLDLGK